MNPLNFKVLLGQLLYQLIVCLQSAMGKWFETWFDSPYYKMLYEDRDELEAANFISKLVQELDPDPDSLFLDLACGAGRHSIYLNSLGYDVVGADYSPSNIATAKQFQNERLAFFEHDMRKPLTSERYNYVLNLFTSFGYFDSDAEHAQTIENIAKGLKPNGMFVLDFMNAEKVVQQLQPSATIVKSNKTFNITKEVIEGRIIKTIKFQDNFGHHTFEEKVRAFNKNELANMIEDAGLSLVNTFGNYMLDDYKPEESDRLILLAQK